MVSKDDVENGSDSSYLAAKVGDKVIVVSDDAGSPWAARLGIKRVYRSRLFPAFLGFAAPIAADQVLDAPRA